MSQLKSQIHRIIKPFAKRLGYVHWRDQQDREPKMRLERTFQRVVNRDVPINTVIDVGAAIGEWTTSALKFYPEANYLLVEANTYHRESLETFTADKPNVQFELVAASDKDGTIYFDDRDPFGGIAAHAAQSSYVELPARSIDSLIQEKQLEPPYLLKLDTHGFEIPILDGASQTLEHTNLVVIETYNFQIQPDSLLFHEMIQYMQDKGFRVADFCDPMHRQLDQTLWQLDFFFIRNDRPEFNSNQYI